MHTKSGFRPRWVCFLLLALADGAQGFDASPVQRLGLDKDYLFPPVPAPPALAATGVTPHSVDESHVVVYQSFQGQTLTLTEFSGKNVSLLLPQTWVTGLTVDERRTLLDRIDLQYEHMKNLLGWEPGGDGLLRIAMVPETCGWGCAYIGAKGIEVLDADWSLGFAKSALALGEVSTVFTHEMTHNFDVYWAYLTYTDAHAWTAFLDAYALVNSQQGVLNASPGDFLFASLWERWNFYARKPGRYVGKRCTGWRPGRRPAPCDLGRDASALCPTVWACRHSRAKGFYGTMRHHPRPKAEEKKMDVEPRCGPAH